MFSPKVILWGGVASAFGGLFWMMTGLAPFGGNATLTLALALSLGGLVGLYSQKARHGGILRLAGFALGVIGTVVALAGFWRPERELARLAQTLLIGSLGLFTLGIGLALLGVVSLRGKTLPRWRGLPLALGLLSILLSISIWRIFYMPLSHGQNPFDPWTPTAYLPVFALFVLMGLGWIGLGAMLATDGDAQIPVAQNPSAST
jgi:hypothetical protein